MKNEVRKFEKLLLKLEWVLGTLVTLYLLQFVALIKYNPSISIPQQIALLVVGFTTFIIGIGCCLKIEQVVGYYECKKCHHRHVPTFSDVLWAMHFGRTRYMECPACRERSWQRKVLSDEEKSGEE